MSVSFLGTHPDRQCVLALKKSPSKIFDQFGAPEIRIRFPYLTGSDRALVTTLQVCSRKISAKVAPAPKIVLVTRRNITPGVLALCDTLPFVPPSGYSGIMISLKIYLSQYLNI